MRRTLDIMRRDDGNIRDGISGGGGEVVIPPINLYYIYNTSGSSAYRAGTGNGFRGSSTSTTAVVVYIEPGFTAASGVLAGYGDVGGTGHSWDFQIYSDGTKYAIRPRLRTTTGTENGAAYRIQASDVGTILTCVATFDGTYLRTYVNGCLVGTAVISGTFTAVGTQRFAILNNNPLSNATLNTEKVGFVGCLTANSILTPTQINTWHNDTVASVDGMPPVFPGGVTVNRYIANSAFDDPSTNDAANSFLDTVGSVTVAQVVANTQGVASVLASAYSTEIAVPALRFPSGSDNFETINHAIGNSGTPYTVNLLVHTSYAPNTGSNEGVLCYRLAVSRGWGIRRMNSTGDLDFFTYDGGANLVHTGTDVGTTGETVRNRTRLITASHDGSNLRLYADGAAVGGTTTCTGYTAPDSSDALCVGDTPTLNIPFLSGAVVGFSIVEGTAWTETEHDALLASVLAANDMVDNATYPATAVWAASDNTAVGNWLDIAGGNSITKVGTPVLVYVARSRFGTET